MKRTILPLLLALLPLLANADAVEIDGIWYNLITKGNVAEVTSSSNKYCGAIEIPESITYGDVNYKVTTIGDWAFSDCSDLTNVTISNNITKIGSCAFMGCSGLTSISIPNTVTNIESSAFAFCSGLTSIIIPNSVKSIESGTFSSCTNLTSVTIPNTILSIGNSAFFGCNLKSVSIPNSVISIDIYAFACTGLISINIPNSVKIIGEGAFSGCCLKSITIGSSVTSIGSSAFANCNDLTDVYCQAEYLSSSNDNSEKTSLYTYENTFDGSYIEYATLHVPSSAINVYKTTEPWSKFGKFVSLSGEDSEMPKCATPTITFENGKIKFSCETEGVEFVSNVSAPDANNYNGSELSLSYKYKVTVYATKAGHENSDTATMEITASGKLGDLNADGKVNAADHVKLSDIIMNQNE